MEPLVPKEVDFLLLQLIISGIAIGAIYGLVALGMVIIYKATRVVNFAHGEMIMISTFVAFTFLSVKFGFWGSLLATLIFAIIMGFLVERIVIEKSSKADAITTTIVTLGIFLCLGDLAIWIWGKDPHKFPSMFSTSPIKVGSVVVSATDLGIIAITLILSFVLFLFFQFSKTGIAIRATADSQTAARLMGVRVKNIYALTWMLASAIGAFAGFLVTPIIYLDVNMMQGILMESLAAGVLGGMTSMPGAMVGGVLLGILENIVGSYSSQLKTAIPFLIILVILMLRPSGLLTSPTRKKV